MVRGEPIWECTCGHREHSEGAPEECVQCGQLDSFMKLPDELITPEEDALAEEDLVEVKPAKVGKPVKKAKRGGKK